jgi:hypothetical protein
MPKAVVALTDSELVAVKDQITKNKFALEIIFGLKLAKGTSPREVFRKKIYENLNMGNKCKLDYFSLKAKKEDQTSANEFDTAELRIYASSNLTIDLVKCIMTLAFNYTTEKKKSFGEFDVAEALKDKDIGFYRHSYDAILFKIVNGVKDEKKGNKDKPINVEIANTQSEDKFDDEKQESNDLPNLLLQKTSIINQNDQLDNLEQKNCNEKLILPGETQTPNENGESKVDLETVKHPVDHAQVSNNKADQLFDQISKMDSKIKESLARLLQTVFSKLDICLQNETDISIDEKIEKLKNFNIYSNNHEKMVLADSNQADINDQVIDSKETEADLAGKPNNYFDLLGQKRSLMNNGDDYEDRNKDIPSKSIDLAFEEKFTKSKKVKENSKSESSAVMPDDQTEITRSLKEQNTQSFKQNFTLGFEFNHGELVVDDEVEATLQGDEFSSHPNRLNDEPIIVNVTYVVKTKKDKDKFAKTLKNEEIVFKFCVGYPDVSKMAKTLQVVHEAMLFQLVKSSSKYTAFWRKVLMVVAKIADLNVSFGSR